LSTAAHPFAVSIILTASKGGSGSPAPRHASSATQADGFWSSFSLVSLGLKNTQAMRWQVAAMETLLRSCGTRSKTQRHETPEEATPQNGETLRKIQKK
jgi:hypothetical protein